MQPAPVLFLDIDGVLNGHDYDPHAQSSGLDPACVEQLNRVLDDTGCQLVISSAWRYMVCGGAMTLRGFEYLLRTHGVRCVDRVLGMTRPDTEAEGQSESPAGRARQILDWVGEHQGVTRWAAVDDLALGAYLPEDRFVRTDGRRGLTAGAARALIYALNKPERATGTRSPEPAAHLTSVPHERSAPRSAGPERGAIVEAR